MCSWRVAAGKRAEGEDDSPLPLPSGQQQIQDTKAGGEVEAEAIWLQIIETCLYMPIAAQLAHGVVLRAAISCIARRCALTGPLRNPSARQPPAPKF